MEPLNNFGIKYLGCLYIPCRKFKKKVDETKSINDNYFKLINLKFLLNEHRRTKIEHEALSSGENAKDMSRYQDCMNKLKTRLKRK